MKDILLKILEWLRVLIKNRESLKKAWELIHPLLKEKLKSKWLNILDKAIKGLNDEAMIALNAAEYTIKNVCESNKEFMKKIRDLHESYYPGILKVTAACAVSGAAVGGGGGAAVGGPAGAALGAVIGVGTGAVGGFLAGAYYALKKHQQDQEKIK